MLVSDIVSNVRYNVSLPIDLVNQINQRCINDFPECSSNFSELVLNLYLFIFLCSSVNDSYYTNISKNDLSKFKKKYKGKTYNYTYFLQILTRLNAIKINSKYSVSNFTKSYAITNHYNNSILTTYTIKPNLIFLNKIDKKTLIESNKEYGTLINNLYSFKVDVEQMNNYLISNKNKYIKTKKVITKDSVNIKRVTLDNTTILRYQLQALKVNFEAHYFKRDAYGRVHTLYTSLPSLLHQFLKHDNETICTLDASNSQPLLLNTLINNEVYKQHTEQGIFYNEFANEIIKLKQTQLKQSVFDEFITKYNITPTSTKQFITDYLKPLVYQILFSSKELMYSNSIAFDALCNLYGASFINDLEVLRKKGNLATTLQGIEASIFIDEFVNDNNIATKHDCLIIPSNEANFYKTKLEQLYKTKLNLNVTFKINE